MDIFTNIFQIIFKLSLYGTVTSLILIIFKRVIGRKVNARLQYVLWFILLVRILIPWMPESNISIFNKTKHIETKYSEYINNETMNVSINDNFDNNTVSSDGYSTNKNYSYDNKAPEYSNNFESDNSERNITDSSKTNTKPKLNFNGMLDVFVIIYYIVTPLILAYLAMGYIVLCLRVNRYKKCDDKNILRMLNICRKNLKINKKIKIYISEKNESPMIFGIINPKIILPNNILQSFQHEDLEFILSHELYHYKKLDLVLSIIINLCMAIYWFNPIILWSLKQMKNDCEKKTDEYVIYNLNREKQINYGKTMLSVISNISECKNIIGTSTILGGKKEMKKRINNIINFKKPTALITICSILLGVIIGVICLTNSMSIPVKADNENNSSESKKSEESTNSSSASVQEAKKNTSTDYAPKDVIEYLKSLQSQLPPASAIDKESMLKKMFNTGAYVASASGEYEEYRSNSYSYLDSDVKEKFNVDFNVKISEDHSVLYKETIKNSSGSYNVTNLLSNDNSSYEIDNNLKYYSQIESDKNLNTVNIPFNNLPINEDISLSINFNYAKYFYNPVIFNSQQICKVLGSYDLYTMFLYDINAWNIVSNEKYLNFNAVKIEGTVKENSFSSVSSVKLWVDSETGVILKYELYDKNGNLESSLEVKKLEINKTIPDSEFQIDTNEYAPNNNNASLINGKQLPKELLDLQNKVSKNISEKISSTDYNNNFEYSSCEVNQRGNINEMMIKISKKNDNISEANLQAFREDLKDTILTDINSSNANIGEIIFILFESTGNKDSDIYTIPSDGSSGGWNLDRQ